MRSYDEAIRHLKNLGRNRKVEYAKELTEHVEKIQPQIEALLEVADGMVIEDVWDNGPLKPRHAAIKINEDYYLDRHVVLGVAARFEDMGYPHELRWKDDAQVQGDVLLFDPLRPAPSERGW